MYLFYDVATDEYTLGEDEDDSPYVENGIFVVYVMYPNITMENDGLGSYEYWGHWCYDEGTWYPVVEDFDIAFVKSIQITDYDINEIDYDTSKIDLKKLKSRIYKEKDLEKLFIDFYF